MIKRTLLANAIRILSIDAVQKANSGHPGAPMGMADIAEVLWRDYINHNPTNPLWSNRDRFVLSNGHGSMLLYSILHLTGYNLPIEELKNFRQIDSKTPGHPEYKITEGVEATTGPLGQGLANAVGMAIAERTLASQFNKPNLNIVDHYTYVFLGDGCLMEGISHEACSLAGTMQLNKLIAFYDNNGISIDGNIKEYFTDDTISRFISYKWNVIKNINGHNSSEIKNAIEEARSIKNKPSIIICDTIIAFGSPNKEGSHEAHGSPLGKEEISATRKKLNWHEQEFIIPKEIYKYWDAKEKGKIKEDLWNKTFELYAQHYPKLAQEFKRRINNVLPNKWEKTIQKIIENTQISKENISTRAASQNILENIGPILPEFLGGSADLTPSNLTTYSKSISILKNKTGNYIHYGVREFGMTAIANGIALYGGFIPYSATFLTFMDYARNAVRMAAMMKIKHIMIYTHDSIGLGEDGPTHQPIEQISSLRAIPNISLWRPCDQIETAVAWKAAIENNDGPTVLILSRQNLQKQTRNAQQLNNINRGGYILKDSKKTPELIFISTGSEVNLAVNAYDRLTQEGYNVRVISLPSTDIFEKQNNHYRDYVLPKQITKRIAIEAGAADYWYKYVGLDGKIIGMTTFGASGPTDKVFKKFGFDANNITNIARNMMKYTNIAE